MLSLMLLAAMIAEPAAPAAAAAPTGTAAAAAQPIKGAKLVCKEIKTTGSRLRNKRTCLPQREWDRMSDDANGTANKEWSTFSKQPNRGCTLSGCI